MTKTSKKRVLRFITTGVVLVNIGLFLPWSALLGAQWLDERCETATYIVTLTATNMSKIYLDPNIPVPLTFEDTVNSIQISCTPVSDTGEATSWVKYVECGKESDSAIVVWKQNGRVKIQCTKSKEFSNEEK